MLNETFFLYNLELLIFYNKWDYHKGVIMSLEITLIFILLLLFVAVLPRWPHSRNWGYWPGGILGDC